MFRQGNVLKIMEQRSSPSKGRFPTPKKLPDGSLYMTPPPSLKSKMLVSPKSDKQTKRPTDNRQTLQLMTQFQIEGGGVVQGVIKLISTFSAFVT